MPSRWVWQLALARALADGVVVPSAATAVAGVAGAATAAMRIFFIPVTTHLAAPGWKVCQEADFQNEVRPAAPAFVRPMWMWLRCAIVGSTFLRSLPRLVTHGEYSLKAVMPAPQYPQF